MPVPAVNGVLLPFQRLPLSSPTAISSPLLRVLSSALLLPPPPPPVETAQVEAVLGPEVEVGLVLLLLLLPLLNSAAQAAATACGPSFTSPCTTQR